MTFALYTSDCDILFLTCGNFVWEAQCLKHLFLASLLYTCTLQMISVLGINYKTEPISECKDRQHRSRGGIGIAFIIHKVKGPEHRAIYQTKARIFLYQLIFRNEICLVNCINKEI